MNKKPITFKSAYLKSFVYLALITITYIPVFCDTRNNFQVDSKIGTIKEVYDGTLLPDLQISTYRNIDRIFPTHIVKHGNNIYPLPKSDRSISNLKFTSAGKDYDLYDYISLNHVTGLLIIKDGKIITEIYQYGNTEETRWMSMSMVKSITATLIGAAIKDGYIKSIDEPIINYLPELRNSAYDGVTIRNLLQMASGVKWNETYTDSNSDRRHLLNAQISQVAGSTLKLMAALPKAAPAGSAWNYSTGETQVAGALLRAAVKKPLAEYLSEKIWSKYGMQSDATWWLESPNGLEIGGSGLSATLRDYGRFGLFLLNGGKIGNNSILPEGWLQDATTSKVIGSKTVDYGYMLWPIPHSFGSIHNTAFEARGIFGQHIYVNPKQNIVITVWSAQSKPTGKAVVADYDFFGAVSNALSKQ